MKRMVFWLFVLLLAAVNWAALHDILKGEPVVWQEWSFVVGSAILVSACLVHRYNHST